MRCEVVLVSCLVACDGAAARPDAAPPVDAGVIVQGDEARADLAINELASAGDDWIELTCRAATPCSLAGHYLTDAPDRLDHFHRFADDVVIAPGGFLVVAADDGETGAHFKLGREDGVYLLDPDGVIVDALLYLGADDGRSLARRPSGAGRFFYATPSRGQVNP